MACRGLHLKLQKSYSVSGNTGVGRLLHQIIKVWRHTLKSEVFTHELGNWDLWWELLITLKI